MATHPPTPTSSNTHSIPGRKSDDRPQHIEEITEDELRAVAPRMRGRKLTAALAFVAGTGFTLFGYALSLLVSEKHQS
jgi:hypothetical protein